MEADAVVELVTASTVLKNVNLEVRVFVGDNDSSSICSIRKESDHQVVKRSDMNHTSKGITNMLYKIDKSKNPGRELSSESIKYLQRCFMYAVAQYKGDSVAMAAAIRNIPFHAFNQHENCGDWCGYRVNKENYTHKIIGDGFKSQVLFAELKITFEKLAENTAKFAAGASSQANESLNGVMSKKAPKSICYSLSESADFRFAAAAVCQENEGERYLQDVWAAPSMSLGTHLSSHIVKCGRICDLKSQISKTKLFKIKRRALQKKRAELHNKKAIREGDTYRSNMGLLDMPAVIPDFNDEFNTSVEVAQHPETTGFQISCDILQISMKSGAIIFDRYINPSQPISPKASEIHGLTNVHGELLLRGMQVPSQPLKIVLVQLLQFLKAFKKPCTLVAHNCSSDAPRLLRNINEQSLVREFGGVIGGFTDTLALFGKKFSTLKSQGQCTLTSLAEKTLSLSPDGAHNGSHDVFLLEKLALFHFDLDDLIANSQSFDKVLEKRKQAENSKNILPTLQPLEKVLSKGMRVRLANAGISYDALVTTYRIKGEQEVVKLLQHKQNGEAPVIKTKKILNNVFEFLKAS